MVHLIDAELVEGCVMANLQSVQQEVHRLLSQWMEVSVGPEGQLIVHRGSTACAVSCNDSSPDGSILVDAMSFVLFDVPLSDELCRWIVVEGSNNPMGKFVYLSGQGSLAYVHTILGDHLDAPELQWMVTMVVMYADLVDDALQDAFGGRRAIDI